MSSLDVPKWYSTIFWTVVGIIFISAIIIAVRTKQQGQDATLDLPERKSIRSTSRLLSTP